MNFVLYECYSNGNLLSINGIQMDCHTGSHILPRVVVDNTGNAPVTWYLSLHWLNCQRYSWRYLLDTVTRNYTSINNLHQKISLELGFILFTWKSTLTFHEKHVGTYKGLKTLMTLHLIWKISSNWFFSEFMNNSVGITDRVLCTTSADSFRSNEWLLLTTYDILLK